MYNIALVLSRSSITPRHWFVRHRLYQPNYRNCSKNRSDQVHKKNSNHHRRHLLKFHLLTKYMFKYLDINSTLENSIPESLTTTNLSSSEIEAALHSSRQAWSTRVSTRNLEDISMRLGRNKIIYQYKETQLVTLSLF